MKTMALWYERLLLGFALLSALLFGGMALWVCYDVLARYAFNRPTPWAVDLSEYAMLWCVFLAAPWVLRTEAHIRIDMFVKLCGPLAERWLGVVTSVVGALVSAILAWQGFLTCSDLYARGITFGREWEVQQYAVYLVIPLGAALLTVEFLVHALRILRPTEGDDEFSVQPRTKRDLL